MNTVSAEIWIPAPPPAIWSVLADVASYPSWNPFIRHVAGVLREKESLQIEVNVGGNAFRKFATVVTVPWHSN